MTTAESLAIILALILLTMVVATRSLSAKATTFLSALGLSAMVVVLGHVLLR